MHLGQHQTFQWFFVSKHDFCWHGSSHASSDRGVGMNKNSRLSLKTMSWLCFTPLTRTRTRRGCTRRLKFDTKTSHGLLTKFRGLGIRITRVRRRTKTKPKKILWPKNIFDPNFSFDPKICFNLNFFQTQNFFLTQNLFWTKHAICSFYMSWVAVLQIIYVF